ncbi:MAG: thioredoxin domain-containing protein [bacterium]
MTEMQALNFLTDPESYFRMRSHKGVTLLTFGVPWSAACNIQNSVTGRVATLFKEKVSFGSVDVDNVPVAKSEFDIHNLPTVVIMKDGSELKRFSGVQPEKTLAKELNAVTGYYVPTEEMDLEWESILDREIEKKLLDKRLLVIDDDPDITFCVMTILQEARFENVEIANNYDSTIKHLNESRPDLIFLNINMYNKEGNRILLTLRRNKDWNRIPLLLSVGPLEPTRVYEDSFKDATILRHGKYVEHPSRRDSFIKLVRHMLLYDMEKTEHVSHLLNISNICPPDRESM